MILYDSKDLTTHAVCVGMTGSGKTGLCLSLLEEAAIDGISPTWWTRYDHNLSHAERIKRVLAWLALPADSAPAVITMYFPDTDDAGHRYGPMAVEVDSAIARVDRSIGVIVDGIDRLGLTDVVNVEPAAKACPVDLTRLDVGVLPQAPCDGEPAGTDIRDGVFGKEKHVARIARRHFAYDMRCRRGVRERQIRLWAQYNRVVSRTDGRPAGSPAGRKVRAPPGRGAG